MSRIDYSKWDGLKVCESEDEEDNKADNKQPKVSLPIPFPLFLLQLLLLVTQSEMKEPFLS